MVFKNIGLFLTHLTFSLQVGWGSAPCHLYFGTLAEGVAPGSVIDSLMEDGQRKDGQREDALSLKLWLGSDAHASTHISSAKARHKANPGVGAGR